MKTAIITGASSGIGLAAARRFAAEKWQLILLARREELLKKIIGELPAAPGAVHRYIPGDYSLPGTAAQLTELLKSYPKIDALVNSFGYSEL